MQPRPMVMTIVLLGGAVMAQAAEKVFDPSRDPARDLLAAETQAKAEHKNILLDVGGNWCPWCIVLDRTLAQDGDLRDRLRAQYVLVHVNWSRENQNAAFLSRYPKPKGYPSWYVLSAKGKLLKVENDTSELEQDHKLGSGYNKERLMTFLDENGQK